MKSFLKLTALAALLSTIHSPQSTALAQGTAFTYQGRLDDGANPASGIYDLRFAIFDAASIGTQQGSTLTNAATAVSNGLFTVMLDFGNQFPGANRWLEIGVRTNGGGAFNTLAPRQPLTSTPYAVRAANAASATSVSGPVAAAQLTGTIASNNIAASSINNTMLANGAVTTSALANGAVTALKVATTTDSTLSTTFANPTPAAFDKFGTSVAAVGSDRVLVGAEGDDTGATDTGAAYLISINGTLLTTFTNPTPAAFDNFGNSVAAMGSDRVLIGAPFDDTSAANAGAAYLFSTNGTLLTTFINPTPANSDLFGNSVASVGSDRVLIGAYGDDTGATDTGAAYLFSTNGTLLTTFTNPTPASTDNFGNSVAAVGSDRVLIGAFQDDTGAGNAGAAYLFSTNGTLLTTFINPTPANSDLFGNSVAAVGSDRVLISAYLDDTGVTDAGAAYLFSTNGTLLTKFTNPTPADSDFFGISVAAVGSDQVVIGAYQDDTGASEAGAAYLFTTNGTLLTTFTNPTPAITDRFGNSVTAVGSDQVVIGAHQDDAGAVNAGAAYLFSLDPPYTPGLIARGVRVGGITTSSLANGAVDSSKIADSSIVNADISPSAAIADTKLATISTAGKVADTALSANVALLNEPNQTFTSSNSFATTVKVGTRALLDTQVVNLRVVGNDGGSWKGGGAFGHSNAAVILGELNGVATIGGHDATLSAWANLIINAGAGNVGIGITTPTNRLHVAGGVSATAFVNTSDRNAKENFAPVEPMDVLNKVAALPISTWNFKEMKDGRHMGPMAQDFHAAFGLGGGDTTITSVDPDGVALAAIQGLNQKLEEREALLRSELKRRDAENAELKIRLEKLEQRLNHRINEGSELKHPIK